MPGRKALVKGDVEYEVMLIDATETPIERPKKTKTLLLWQKKATYIKGINYREQEEKGNYLYPFFRRKAA